MYTLDANIFIRDLDTREPDHQDCHALLELLNQRGIPIVVPALVLAEVAGTISRVRRDPIVGRLAAELLQGMSNLSCIPLDNTRASVAAEIAADYGLRGADAVYVMVARMEQCVLISFDREIRERTGAIIQVQTPSMAIADLLQI